MASLFNTRISDTYQGLIKTIDNAAITATLKELTDGSGNATGVYLNNAGDFKVTAILEFGSLKDTGENIIISKFVDAADGVLNNDNDTSIPTTAAIIDYVQGHVTLQDLDFEGDSGNGSVDLDSQLLDIAGTANQITTVASNQTLTISLDSSGVVLPNGSTATTQSQGDNSTKIATTAYVDILDAASDLDFSGDSGTGDVNLNSQTFAITGTTNQIITAASGQGLSLSLPATVHRNLQGDVTGNVTGDLTGNVTATSVLADGVTATTQASSDDSTKVATTAYVKSLNNASDLDFTTDSGSGAVVLNTETLSVIGTANEIETSGSGQQIQIGLPSSINVNVTGNLTGNVTGNVTGDVIGDVTGDLTGNADTATTWQTARDLSLTGQATGTISSVDGSGNVSGSVTLDNNSVTAKVLTGLTSPSASSVLATDTILEGFGKLQSQVNGLAGGLRFMGSWDADTNSPVLSSGGGEAANGTTTGVQANKLIDSSASFTTTVTVGDKVINQVDGQSALVTNIDSNTTLSLDADIMLSGEDYTIDNSPFITQGHYYVVSVGGTTTLNGVSNWTVGDWVIAGANNQWTKLDHSQVDGTGTTGNLTKWSGTQVIADSIVSESGSAITVDGSLSTNTNLSSTGDFAVNTNKFNVAAASGNTSFAGNLAINTNKFTVNSTTGNTLVAGTLDVTGKTTFGDDITISDSTPILDFEDTDNTDNNWRMEARGSFGGFFFQSFDNNFQTGSTVLFAKYSNGYIGLGGNTNPQAQLDITGGLITSGDATFAGNLTANVGTFNSDSGGTGLKIIGRSAANAGTLRYYQNNGTTQTARIESNDSIFEINSISNLPIQLKTNDTLALTLDTSQNATFAGNVAIGYAAQSNIRTFVYDNSSNYSLAVQQDGSGVPLQVTSAGSIRLLVANNGNVGIGTSSPSATLELNSATSNEALLKIGRSTNPALPNNLQLGTSGGDSVITAVGTSSVNGSLIFQRGTTSANTESMRIDSSGNVGINKSPQNFAQLEVKADTNGKAALLLDSNALTQPAYTIYEVGGSAGWEAGMLGNGDSYAFAFSYGDINTSSNHKMRITSGGNLDFNEHTGATIGYGFRLTSASDYSQIYMEATTTSSRIIQRYYNPNGNVGNITISGSSTSYGTTSDYRLKEDLQDFNGLDKVSKIPVYDFKWKSDENRSYGVMAHELQEVLPDAVNGEKDAEEMQSVDYSKIVPLLVKSIQEQQEMINDLKGQIDNLKCNCKN